jgi:hypothetical protein
MLTQANLQIYQGDSYNATVTVLNQDGTGADLTGYTAHAHIRISTADQSEVWVSMATQVTLPNTILLSLTPADTAALSYERFYWDLQVIAPDNTTATLLAGRVDVALEITSVPPGVPRPVGSLRMPGDYLTKLDPTIGFHAKI